MVGIGSRDLIIVDTNSTVLIANKNDSKQVLNIVSHLKKMRINEGKNHQIIYKNLEGSYTFIAKGDIWQLKTI